MNSPSATQPLQLCPFASEFISLKTTGLIGPSKVVPLNTIVCRSHCSIFSFCSTSTGQIQRSSLTYEYIDITQLTFFGVFYCNQQTATRVELTFLSFTFPAGVAKKREPEEPKAWVEETARRFAAGPLRHYHYGRTRPHSCYWGAYTCKNVSFGVSTFAKGTCLHIPSVVCFNVNRIGHGKRWW